MGDARYQRHLSRLTGAGDPSGEVQRLDDDAVIQALAAASREQLDPYLANVLATEAMNRMRRSATITSAAAEGLVSLSGEGRVLHANPAAVALLQRASAELAGAHYRDVLCPVDEEGEPLRPDRCPITRVLRTGERLVRQEVRLLRKGGKVLPALASIAPIQREGTCDGVVVTFTDISERLKAEAALFASRERLHHVLDALTEGVVVLEPGGCVQFINRACERLLGAPRERILGAPPDRRPWETRRLDGTPVAPDELPGIVAMREDRPLKNVRVLIVRPDGTELLVEMDATPLHEAGSRAPTGVVLSFDDVTQRERAEVALRRSEERHRGAFLRDLAPTVVVNRAGEIVDANPASEALGGLTAEEARGRSFAEFIHPLDLPRAWRNFQRVMGGETRNDRYQMRRRDGASRPIRVMGIPITEEGRVVGMHARITLLDAAGRPV